MLKHNRLSAPAAQHFARISAALRRARLIVAVDGLGGGEDFAVDRALGEEHAGVLGQLDVRGLAAADEEDFRPAAADVFQLLGPDRMGRAVQRLARLLSRLWTLPLTGM